MIYKSRNRRFLLVVLLPVVLFMGGWGNIYSSDDVPGNPSGVSGEDILLKLPVRVIRNVESMKGAVNQFLPDVVKNLEMRDFEIRIDGLSCPIREFQRRSRSLGGVVSNHGNRKIALSFDIDSYGAALREAVSTLVKGYISSSDELWVCTPLSVYKLDAAVDKNDILKMIEVKLEKDTAERKKMKGAVINGLNILMDKVEPLLDAKKADLGAVQFFLSYFSTEWNIAVREFLLLNLEKFNEVASKFMENPGEESGGNSAEKWLIHFQEEDYNSIDAIPGRFQRISGKIKVFTESIKGKARVNVPPLLEKLKGIESNVGLVDVIPLESLSNGLIGVNLSCHMMFLSPEGLIISPGLVNHSVFSNVLRTVALSTGGMWVRSSNPTEGLRGVVNHVDSYYELGIKVDPNVLKGGGATSPEPGNGMQMNSPEDKSIVVSLTSSEGTVYSKNKLKKEEVKLILSSTGDGADVTVSDFKQEGNRIGFNVRGFQIRKGSGGVVKVDIRLIDEQQSVVYETGRTIKAGADPLSISLEIPVRFKGYYKLVISALDIQSGINNELKQYLRF